MSQNERIKEKIGWLKVIFGVLVALDASVVAWLAQNFTALQPVLLLGSLVIVIVLTSGVIWVNRVAYRRLAQLEDL